ncbi:MAG: NAD(P)H-hydrate epimerase, partial [Hydrogenophaga sp.]|nr:NAD(P)H-hydrate epimerase [Hydrogenophaga sp.]
MRRIGSTPTERLHGTHATRAIEQWAAAARPAHGLMALAGQAVARLTSALAPHARCVWVACGPGNNGGDGLIAAMHLHHQARSTGADREIVVTLCADSHSLPPDATDALHKALAAGLTIANEPPAAPDFVIDALLGIGRLRTPEGRLANHMDVLQNTTAPVLCVDLPSGLDANTGVHLRGSLERPPKGPRYTLSLLTLKPGLFTADGRDQAGEVWFDDLGVDPPADAPVAALISGMAPHPRPGQGRAHASHKGSQGDVLVIGGQHIAVNGSGMT